MTTIVQRLEKHSMPVPFCGCIVWLGNVITKGYGYVWNERRNRRAHIVAWELINGPVPQGLELDHLCRVRCCINPDQQRAKTHCPYGHEYSIANTYIRKDKGRGCRECCKRRTQEYRDRKRKAA